MMAVVDNSELRAVAQEARTKLERVCCQLEGLIELFQGE